MYDGLYSPNVGLGGFACRTCKRVTRTERGMKSHIWRVHGEKVQASFNFDEPPVQPIFGQTGDSDREVVGPLFANNLCGCDLASFWSHAKSVHGK